MEQIKNWLWSRLVARATIVRRGISFTCDYDAARNQFRMRLFCDKMLWNKGKEKMTIVKHCSACEKQAAQPNQRYCRECHNAYMRAWRKGRELTADQRFKDKARSYANVYKQRGKLAPEPCLVCEAKLGAGNASFQLRKTVRGNLAVPFLSSRIP